MFKVTAQSILQQDVLRRIEALCTQEEPPACEAACPLHLDVRGMNGLIKDGKAKEAQRMYAKAIPFSAIIAHTCDAPCRSVCRRAEVGGAIEIRKLEQALTAEYGKPTKPPMLFPKKTQRVGIIGGGLRGMVAALDTCKKGYKVSIYERLDRLGGKLAENPSLPADVLEAETTALGAFPITIKLNTEVDVSTTDALQSFINDEGLDAVYVACKSPIEYDESSLATALPNLLAGSIGGRMTEGDSSIYDAYDGRSAATTLDRILQQVSIEAGRGREGSRKTRLYTNLEGIAEAVPVQAESYSAEQAEQEAGRCIQCECLECVKKCGFMQHYKSYPKKLAREVYNNLSIAMGIHHANAMINSCALCGQCGAICPNGLDMAEIYTAAREQMNNSGKMPPSAHEFAMLDMEYSLSDSFYMARHGQGRDASEYVFFPGCQLAASEPELTRAVYEDLAAKHEGGVGLMLGCCGVMAKWAGDSCRYDNAVEQLCEGWKSLGCPTVIAGCPTCAITLADMGMDVISIYDMDGVGTQSGAGKAGQLHLHHACGARHDEKLRGRIAGIAAEAGIELLEQESSTDTSPCCGYGGLTPFANADVAQDITATALQQMPDEPTLTYCVNCRDRYLHEGAESYHLLELLYPDAPLRRTWPTWSDRQYNRADLKRSMLRDIWGEQPPEDDSLKLYMDDELIAKLEKTKILAGDISAAIECAERENCRLRQPETGHFITNYRPNNVTFWVEYSPEGEGWRVHNAYCHRLEAVVTSSITSARGD